MAFLLLTHVATPHVSTLAQSETLLLTEVEFEMLHDDEVIPKYAASIVIGRVKGQTPSLEI